MWLLWWQSPDSGKFPAVPRISGLRPARPADEPAGLGQGARRTIAHATASHNHADPVPDGVGDRAHLGLWPDVGGSPRPARRRKSPGPGADPWTGPKSSGPAWSRGTRGSRRSGQDGPPTEAVGTPERTAEDTRRDHSPDRRNPAWGDLEYYEGRALFKSPNLAFIDFLKIKQDEKKQPIKDPQKGKWVSTPYERIVCTGDEVWQYRSDTQQIFVFPLEKNEQKKAIEEGPLPFLFNMRADEARQRYQMNLISEDQKSYGISIRPKLKEDKESFSRAFVNLDRKYLLPVRIVMLSPDGKSKKDFRLGPMYPNREVNDHNFEGKPLGKPWKSSATPPARIAPRQWPAPVRPEASQPPLGPQAEPERTARITRPARGHFTARIARRLFFHGPTATPATRRGGTGSVRLAV